ncbi:60Kd inner membrane protein-domain-containing protein [Cristinia sonorae]|uniref:60Kd inner membrane protein-domain-containing protein n=1 Tax=Cristinia sonorae TaxID=1940300 RepID=A0A8K0XU66_9AGAR|nr:60Kd inner membrane protein-domain-containing protein [Cristinia sonorae]
MLSSAARVSVPSRLAWRVNRHAPSVFNYTGNAGRPSRRTFITTTIQSASNGFLDLALALPYSELIPPYSATIILTTVASRLLLTVPFSIWAKRRQWILEDVVVPQLRAEMPAVRKSALQDMKTDRFRGNEDEARMELGKRAKQKLDRRRRELTSSHGCSPVMTMLLPAISQLPLFVGFSMMLNNLSKTPTVFDSESFLTLTSLAHSDPTLTLPIVIGLISFANTESSRWFISAEAAKREAQVQEWTDKRRSKGETVIQPKKIIQTTLRIYSVARILISALFPGSVQLYWATSAAFGLVQTWALDFWDLRRLRPLSTTASPPSEAVRPKSAGKRTS